MNHSQMLSTSSANEPITHLGDGLATFTTSSAAVSPRPPPPLSARRGEGGGNQSPPRPLSRTPTPIKRTSSLIRRRQISKQQQYDDIAIVTPASCGGCGQCCRNCEKLKRGSSFLRINNNRINGGNSSNSGGGFGGMSAGGSTQLGIGTTADTAASHLADFEVYGVATHQTPPSTPNSGVPTRKNSSSVLHSARFKRKHSSMMMGERKPSSMVISQSHPGIVLSRPGYDDDEKKESNHKEEKDDDENRGGGKLKSDAFGTSADDDTTQHSLHKINSNNKPRNGFGMSVNFGMSVTSEEEDVDKLDISGRENTGERNHSNIRTGNNNNTNRSVGIVEEDITSSPNQQQLVEELTIEEMDEDQEENDEEEEMCCDAHWSVYEGLEMVICGDRYFSFDFILYGLGAIFIGIVWLLLWTALPSELSEPAGAIFGPASTIIVCTFVGQYIVGRNLGLPSIVGVFFVAVIWNHVYEIGFLSQGTTEVVRFVISRVGLTTILIRAGMALSWKSIKPTVFYTTALATIPLALETVTSALLSHTLFSDTYNFDWRWAFLHGLTCSVVAAGVIAPEMLNLALKGYTTGVPPLALSAVGPDTAIGVWAIGFVVQTIFSDHSISLIASLGPVQLFGSVIVGVLIGCVFSLYLRLLRRNMWNNPVVMRRMTLACFLSIACAVTFFGEKFVLVGGEAIITLSFATTVGHILQWEALREDAYLATHIIKRNTAAEEQQNEGRRRSQTDSTVPQQPHARQEDDDEEMVEVGSMTRREHSNNNNNNTPTSTTTSDRKQPTFAMSTSPNTANSSSLVLYGLENHPSKYNNNNNGSQTARNRRRSSTVAPANQSATPRLVAPPWQVQSGGTGGGVLSSSPRRFSDTPVTSVGQLGASLSTSISDPPPPVPPLRPFNNIVNNTNNNSTSTPASPCVVPSLVPPLFKTGMVFGRSPGSTSAFARSPLTGRLTGRNNNTTTNIMAWEEDPLAGTNMTHLTTQEDLDESIFDVYRGDSTHRDGMATFRDTYRDNGGGGNTHRDGGGGATFRDGARTYRAVSPLHYTSINNNNNNGSELLATYREDGDTNNNSGSPRILRRSGTVYESLRTSRRLASTTSGEVIVVEVVTMAPTHDSSRLTIALPDRKHRCAAQMRADLVLDLCDFWNYIVAGPLFSMSGTLVDLTQLFSLNFFPKGILILGVGGVVRMIATALCTIGMGWSWKEIAFLPLVWLGKGSVQAATGGVALETAKILLKNLPDSATVEEIADAERMVEAGRIILNTASLYVLVAAPLCAICITRLGPILLTKPISSIAHHQPGGR